MGNIHALAIHLPRTTAEGSSGPWPAANATGKTTCGTERRKPSGNWLDKAREQSTGRHDWSKTGGARLFWVWQSWPHPNKLPSQKGKITRCSSSTYTKKRSGHREDRQRCPPQMTLRRGRPPLRMKMPSESTSRSMRRTFSRLPLGKMNSRCPSTTGTTKMMTLGHRFGQMPSVPQRWGTA